MRHKKTQDMIGAAVYFASPASDFVTGQVLYVDGGMLAQLRSPQVDAPLPDSVAKLLRRDAGS